MATGEFIRNPMKLNHQDPHFFGTHSKILYIFKIYKFVQAPQVVEDKCPLKFTSITEHGQLSHTALNSTWRNRSLFPLDFCVVRLDSSNGREENTGEKQKTNGGERDLRQKRSKYDKMFFADR